MQLRLHLDLSLDKLASVAGSKVKMRLVVCSESSIGVTNSFRMSWRIGDPVLIGMFQVVSEFS